MQFQPLLVLLSSLPALSLAAVSFNVDVGKNGLAFTPDLIHASVGDLVHFHYYPGDHGVAQSTYQSPCVPSGPNGIWSGFFNPSSGVASKEFTVTIKNTSPIWIYCPQDGHCGLGMSMVINPAAGQTLTSYKTRSRGKTSQTPKKVQGGVIGPNHGS